MIIVVIANGDIDDREDCKVVDNVIDNNSGNHYECE